MYSYLDSKDKTAVIAKRMKYFTKNGKRPYTFVALLILYFFLP